MSDKKIIRLHPSPKNLAQATTVLDEQMFESAMPAQHNHCYYEDAAIGLYIGVWDTTDMVSKPAPYAYDEFMVLLEGQAGIHNIKTGEREIVNAGEVIVIPHGYDCQWRQKGYLRKFYVRSKHPNEITPIEPTCEGLINISKVHQGVPASTDSTSNIKVNVSGDSFIMKAGQTVKKGQHLYQSHRGNFFSGIWQSEQFETQQQAFPRNEFIYIESGELVCIDQDNQAHRFSKGDACFIPQGTICHWRVDESVCTFYAVLQSTR